MFKKMKVWYSVIAGGNTNTINSSSSSILGGTGNTIPAGMPNTHIVGGGIAAVLPNALHVNGLWANGIPLPPVVGPLAPGTVFWQPFGAPPPIWAYPATTGVLWIA